MGRECAFCGRRWPSPVCHHCHLLTMLRAADILWRSTRTRKRCRAPLRASRRTGERRLMSRTWQSKLARVSTTTCITTRQAPVAHRPPANKWCMSRFFHRCLVQQHWTQSAARRSGRPRGSTRGCKHCCSAPLPKQTAHAERTASSSAVRICSSAAAHTHLCFSTAALQNRTNS